MSPVSTSHPPPPPVSGLSELKPGVTVMTRPAGQGRTESRSSPETESCGAIVGETDSLPRSVRRRMCYSITRT